MNMKLSGIVAACMLAMAFAPMGLAHRDDLSTAADADLDNRNDSTVNSVSGNVVGAASPRFMLLTPDPDLDQGTSLAGGLCDAEAVTGANDGSNERYIDGYDVFTLTGVGPLAGTNQVPEGKWDDGGFGAVCHTTNMPGTEFDTWGCNYDNIVATDALANQVWVLAGCDWGFGSGGSSFDPTPLPGADAFQNCIINTGILGNLGTPDEIPDDQVTCQTDHLTYVNGYVLGADATPNTADDGVPLLVECIVEDVQSLVAPDPAPTCPPPTGGSFDCHANGVQTGQGFEDTAAGMGNTGVDVPSPEDIPNNGSLAYQEGCDDEDGIATIFVYNSVVVDESGGGIPATTGTAPATIVAVSTAAYV